MLISTVLCVSNRAHFIDPNVTMVAIDDVGNLEDFDEFPAFPQLADAFSNVSDDSGFVNNSQSTLCPCCLQEINDLEMP